VKSCAFSPDGKSLACAGTDDKTYFLDVETLKPTREPFVTDATYTDCIAYLPGTNHLAVVGFDHELKIFDVESGELLRKSERYPSFFATVRVSADGSRIGVGAMDGKFRVFRAEDCQELINFEIPRHYCYCDFSSDGQSLAIAAGGDAFVVRGTGADELSKLSVTELKDIACAKLRVLSKD
jgi:WD40 repeat protein